MIISNMRFDGFEWEHNPLSVQVLYSNNFKVHNLYSQGNIAFPSGRKLRVVKGKGEFAGKDCIVRYKELAQVFAKGRKALLSLPFDTPFYAYFTELSLVAQPSPDFCEYTFEFMEAQTSPLKNIPKVYIPQREGETLFDIAYEFGVRVDKLVELNPQLRRADDLPLFKEVRLC